MQEHEHQGQHCVMCEKGPEGLHAGITKNIKEHGRSIIMVHGDADHPPFAYTIGNSLSDKPELLLVGIDPRHAGAILNKLSENDAIGFRDDELVSLGGRHPLRLERRDLLAREHYTIQAGQYLGRQDYPVMQVIIPDKQGCWPDQLECDPHYQQQLLGTI